MSIGLRNDLERLEDAMAAANMAWWEIEFPSGTVFFADNKTKMLGYEKQNFFHYSNFTDLLHPDDYPVAMKAMEDHIKGLEDFYETTYRIKSAHGDYRTFYDKGRIVQRQGKEFTVAGIVIDVTDMPDSTHSFSSKA